MRFHRGKKGEKCRAQSSPHCSAGLRGFSPCPRGTGNVLGALQEGAECSWKAAALSQPPESWPGLSHLFCCSQGTTNSSTHTNWLLATTLKRGVRLMAQNTHVLGSCTYQGTARARSWGKSRHHQLQGSAPALGCCNEIFHLLPRAKFPCWRAV